MNYEHIIYCFTIKHCLLDNMHADFDFRVFMVLISFHQTSEDFLFWGYAFFFGFCQIFWKISFLELFQISWEFLLLLPFSAFKKNPIFTLSSPTIPSVGRCQPAMTLEFCYWRVLLEGFRPLIKMYVKGGLKKSRNKDYFFTRKVLN